MGNSRSIGVSRAVCRSRTARPFFDDREEEAGSRPGAGADQAASAALVGESRSIEDVLSDRRLRRSLGKVLYEYRIPVQDAEDQTALQHASAPEQERWALLADLGAAVRQLPATQRRLMVLRWQFGLTPPEAAAAIGLASGSVRTVFNRGLARLREAQAGITCKVKDFRACGVYECCLISCVYCFDSLGNEVGDPVCSDVFCYNLND